MSIGISVILPDGVVLIADGRDRLIFGERVPVDGIDKLQPVGESAFAIAFGVTVASRAVIEDLRQGYSPLWTPETFAHSTEAAVRKSWADLVARVDGSVDLTDPHIGVSVIVAGIAQGQPFALRSALSSWVTIPVQLGLQPMTTVIFGGEEQNADQVFNQRASEALKGIPWSADDGPSNEAVQRLIDTAAGVIDGVAELNTDVGFSIRYAVVRQDFPVIKEIWNGSD